MKKLKELKRTGIFLPRIVYDQLAILAIKRNSTIYRLIWEAVEAVYGKELRQVIGPEWVNEKINWKEDEDEQPTS